MATRAELSGSLVLTPPSGAGGTQTASFRELGTYGYDERRPFAGTYVSSAVALDPITQVKMIMVTADTPIDLKITTADGADQVIPVDRLLVLHCPSKPITAIKLNGTSNGTLIFAGD